MVNTKLKVFDLASGTNLICRNIHVDHLRDIAKAYGFEQGSVEKLLSGPDRYSFIRSSLGGGYNLTKRFVTRAQYDSVKFNDYAQQGKEVVNG